VQEIYSQQILAEDFLYDWLPSYFNVQRGNSMSKYDYTVTFACYNALSYTQLCIESMQKHRNPIDRLVIVDNCSTDGTQDYLRKLRRANVIFNKSNLGCGVAWNQGALLFQSDWTVVMNNDVIVSEDWINRLIDTAIELGVKVISPACINGDLDYDFDKFQIHAYDTMKSVHRIGDRGAVCMAIHKSVWHDVGYFRATPKLLGYEDTLFFDELDKAKIRTAVTGACWLHHYGSITQSLMKAERGLRQKDGLGYRYNYKLLRQSWLKRKLEKMRMRKHQKQWRESELRSNKMTLHGVRSNGQFQWL
jgi:N-acetylglucosaminyl-diphospho-decaprenol L-rhamnosyltransferase